MFEQIKEKLKDEQVQRAALQFGGAIATFVASYAINKMLSAGVDAGINKLMEKLHPTTETPAE